MNQTAQELAAENQARAMVYNFLSSLFAQEITDELVTQLSAEQGQGFLNFLALEPSLAPHVKVIMAKIKQLNTKESLLELAADFCGLFLVDGKTSVSPYAGQYLSNKPGQIRKKDRAPLFGDLHQQMSEFLTKSNMQIHKGFPEPADHLAVMLAYLGHLSVTTSVENQHNFIENYLMTWMEDFSRQVHKNDPDGFYAALTELTHQWLKLEVLS